MCEPVWSHGLLNHGQSIWNLRVIDLLWQQWMSLHHQVFIRRSSLQHPVQKYAASLLERKQLTIPVKQIKLFMRQSTVGIGCLCLTASWSSPAQLIGLRTKELLRILFTALVRVRFWPRTSKTPTVEHIYHDSPNLRVWQEVSSISRGSTICSRNIRLSWQWRTLSSWAAHSILLDP